MNQSCGEVMTLSRYVNKITCFETQRIIIQEVAVDQKVEAGGVVEQTSDQPPNLRKNNQNFINESIRLLGILR